MQSTITLIYLVILKKGDDGVKLTYITAQFMVTWQLTYYMVWIRYNYRMIIFFSILHTNAFYFNLSQSVMWRK